jgi:hypothetical protein
MEHPNHLEAREAAPVRVAEKKRKRPKLAEVLEESDDLGEKGSLNFAPMTNWTPLNPIKKPELAKIFTSINTRPKSAVNAEVPKPLPAPEKMIENEEEPEQKQKYVEENKKVEESKEKSTTKNGSLLMNKLKEKVGELSITIPVPNKRPSQFLYSSVNHSNSIIELGTPPIMASGFPQYWDKILSSNKDEISALISPMLFGNSGAESRHGQAPFFIPSSNERSTPDLYNSGLNHEMNVQISGSSNDKQ